MPDITDLIKKELAVNRFRPMRLKNIPYDTIIEELAKCLYPTYHEGRVQPFGVLFCSEDIDGVGGLSVKDSSSLSVDEIRSIADGRRTFMAIVPNSEPQLVFATEAVADEPRLLDLARSVQGLVVKRDETGTVWLAQKGDIWRVEGRTWSRKPQIRNAASLVRLCLGEPLFSLYPALQSLLNFSYYYLSGQNIGATLVWRLYGEETDTVGDLSRPGSAVLGLEMQIDDQTSYPILAHLLGYHDGATIIGPTGELERIGAHLEYSADTSERIKSESGTRHTSGRRFSFEHPEVLVFVISQDGPVSIYSDGYKVTEMAPLLASMEAQSIIDSVPAKSGQIETFFSDERCPNCDRLIRVEQVIVYGWRDRESVDCPCCGHPDIYSAMCFSLLARPIKSLPHPP